MHSIGSAHAEVRSRRRETSLASTTDRILLIIGNNICEVLCFDLEPVATKTD